MSFWVPLSAYEFLGTIVWVLESAYWCQDLGQTDDVAKLAGLGPILQDSGQTDNSHCSDNRQTVMDSRHTSGLLPIREVLATI